MRIELEAREPLRFDDGSAVHAASAMARLGDGWLISQDDATHAAWRRPDSVTPVRVLPPVDGHDTFSSQAGTKHLKPDLEAACETPTPGVLLLGSGSAPARMRASLVTLSPGGPRFVAADLTPLYDRVQRVLDLPAGELNLEGACLHGDRVRWFQRGTSAADHPSMSVDVDLRALLAAVTGAGPCDAVEIGNPRRYELGDIDGVALAITDALPLPDGRVLVSAAAEDTPDPVDDGPVSGSALALIDEDRVVDVTTLPGEHGHKVEGLAPVEFDTDGVRLLAVVDDDAADAPSMQLTLRVRW